MTNGTKVAEHAHDENVDRAGPRQVVRHTLTATEAAEAFALANDCARTYKHVDDPEFLADVAVIAHDLPRSVRQAMNNGRLDDRKHAIVVSGNQIDDERIGATPASWIEADNDNSRVYAFLVMIYSALLGDAIGWATQQDGRLVTDVLPTKGMEHSLVSASSEKELGWHTEDAFSPARADYVGLLCLRSPQMVGTTVGYIDLGDIPASLSEVLMQERFHTFPDTSHENAHPVVPRAVPVFEGCSDAPVLRIDRDFTVAMDGDTEAQRALSQLIAHLDRNVYELTLAPGDVAFIDNRNVVHGRRPFQPLFNGKDRWLKRVNVVEELRRTRPGRPTSATRVIG
ncbi:guanitoxin biosynthesis L-enduracididine beta-hydroxylase GntD [Kibdelosporangium aridum]|nr:guanitoxin biosynthesis L-enduracididine beta-hydroxylase GntD [Kibdelosporangium aridum]